MCGRVFVCCNLVLFVFKIFFRSQCVYLAKLELKMFYFSCYRTCTLDVLLFTLIILFFLTLHRNNPVSSAVEFFALFNKTFSFSFRVLSEVIQSNLSTCLTFFKLRQVLCQDFSVFC